MSLFTDSDLVGISDLDVYESTLSKTASSHGINLSSKTAIALAAIGDKLLGRLQHIGRTPIFVGSVLNGTQQGSYQGWGLNNVVVTPPLRRWLSYEILSQVFAEAYNVQLNDRFKAKWMEYSGRANEAERNVYELGIGVVRNPLSRPPDATVAITSGNQPAGIVTVQTSWVDAAGNESALSRLVPVTLPESSSFVISGPGANAVPASATGWNVYVSADGEASSRQNTSLIPVTDSWPLPASGYIQGASPLDGQPPDLYLVDPRRIFRG
jgi:hypothetical protein